MLIKHLLKKKTISVDLRDHAACDMLALNAFKTVEVVSPGLRLVNSCYREKITCDWARSEPRIHRFLPNWYCITWPLKHDHVYSLRARINAIDARTFWLPMVAWFTWLLCLLGSVKCESCYIIHCINCWQNRSANTSIPPDKKSENRAEHGNTCPRQLADHPQQPVSLYHCNL